MVGLKVQMTSDDVKYKRLKWRSRRGMLELDLLLLPFLEEVYRDLSDTDQSAYEKLLEQDDPDLLEWFSQKSVPEEEDLNRLVRMILGRVQPE
jgi:antitoxin CptB